MKTNITRAVFLKNNQKKNLLLLYEKKRQEIPNKLCIAKR